MSTSSSGGVRLPPPVRNSATPKPQFLPSREIGNATIDVQYGLQELRSRETGNPCIDYSYGLQRIGSWYNEAMPQLLEDACEDIVSAEESLEEYSVDDVSTTKIADTPRRTEALGWYIQNGGALLVFTASLATALVLIFVEQVGIGPAFTAAGWVLAGGSLLTITVKTCISERPKKSRVDRDVALESLTHEGRRRL